MKNLILITSLICIGVFANAQITKGTQTIGFQVQFSKITDKAFDSSGTKSTVRGKSTGGGIGLRYGIFITDRILLGLAASVNGNNSHFENVNYIGDISFNDQYSNQMNAGVFARYYKMIGKTKFVGIGQLNFNYNISENKNHYMSIGGNSLSQSKTSGISGFLSAGIGYFLNKHIALELFLGSVGFTNYKTANFSGGIKYNESSSFNLYSYSIFPLSSMNLGLNFYFGGKKKEAEPSATTP